MIVLLVLHYKGLNSHTLITQNIFIIITVKELEKVGSVNVLAILFNLMIY